MSITYDAISLMAFVRGCTLRHGRHGYRLDYDEGYNPMWSFFRLRDVAQHLASLPAVRPYPLWTRLHGIGG